MALQIKHEGGTPPQSGLTPKGLEPSTKLAVALGGEYEVEFNLDSQTVLYGPKDQPEKRIQLPQPTMRTLSGREINLFKLSRTGPGEHDFVYLTYDFLRDASGEIISDSKGAVTKPTRIFWFSEQARSRTVFGLMQAFSRVGEALQDPKGWAVSVLQFSGIKGSYDHRLGFSCFMMSPREYDFADFVSTQNHEGVHRSDYLKGRVYDFGRAHGESASEVRAHLFQAAHYRRLGRGIPEGLATDENIVQKITDQYGPAQGVFSRAYINALRRYQHENGLQIDEGLLISPVYLKEELDKLGYDAVLAKVKQPLGK